MLWILEVLKGFFGMLWILVISYFFDRDVVSCSVMLGEFEDPRCFWGFTPFGSMS